MVFTLLSVAVHCLLYQIAPVDYESRINTAGRIAWLRVHAYVTWVLFEVIVAMSFLVVVVFWTLLTPDAATAGSFLNINQHVLNMVLTYTCFTLSRVHIVFSHFVFFLLIAALYMVTQFV